MNPPCFFIRTPHTILISQGGEFTAGVDDEGNGRGLALWGPLKAATADLTGERFVGVLEGTSNLSLGLGGRKSCSLDLDDSHSRNPPSGAGWARPEAVS